tara:strand:- start:41 stop:538 length:498 start_codon:yes stop_codon:yes gene_type:complete
MNEVKLQENHPIDDVLRPLKVAGTTSSLEIATKDNGAKVTGDFDCQGDIATNNIIATNTIVFGSEHANTVTTGLITIDWNVSQKQSLTITGTGCTITFTAPPGACNLILKVVQGDGSDTVGHWSPEVKWAGGSAPTLSSGSADIDVISFYYDGTNYYGVASLDFG